MLRRVLAVIAVLGSGAALAACGGSNDSTGSDETAASSPETAPAAALPAEDFVEQADAICREAKGDYLEFVRQAGAASAAGESQAKPLAGIADLSHSLESALAGLSPPTDLTSTFDSYLNIKQDQATVADDLAQAAAESTSAEISPEMKSLFDEFESTGLDSAKLATELGFKVCV